MKNIIVGGTVRSGKSTLASKLVKKLNYSLFESDTVVHAFNETFPEIGIVHRKPKEAREIYKPFMYVMLNGLCKSLKHNDIVSVFPGAQFLPEHLKDYEKLDRYIVIFLGLSTPTPQQLFEKFREMDKPSDWTYKESDEKLLKHCETIIKESKLIETQCKEYGFYYFDTFSNREKVFNDIVKLVEKEQQ